MDKFDFRMFKFDDQIYNLRRQVIKNSGCYDTGTTVAHICHFPTENIIVTFLALHYHFIQNIFSLRQHDNQ